MNEEKGHICKFEKGTYMFYFKCDNCGYGIKQKGATITTYHMYCPICNKSFTIRRATYEEYKACKTRDSW